MYSFKFTLGFPVYRDFDGLFFSIQALNLYHNHFFTTNEILVVDNAPNSPEGQDIKKVVERLAVFYRNVRYVPLQSPTGTAVAKQKIFDEANGRYVIVLDAHVLLFPGALETLEAYYDSNPESKDIISGPLVLDDGLRYFTHFVPKWRGQMFGTWGRKEITNDEPFEIPGCGTGCFAMKKDEWPGFHPLSRGFDCEALYIHEKVRRRGGKAICLPRFRWMHRFSRPGGIPYNVTIWHKARNYILEFKELNWPIDELETYFVGGGFLAKKDWDILVSDPEKLVDPSMFISFAEDEKKLPQIIDYEKGKTMIKDPMLHRLASQKVLENQQSSGTQVTAETENRIVVPVQPTQQSTPPQNTISTSRPQNTGGCSSCQKKAAQQIQIREDIIKRLLQYKNLSELYLDVRSGAFGNVLEGVQEKLEEIASKSNMILEVSDDPVTTITILKNMSKDALLVSFYFDQKFLPELSVLRELAKQEDKKFNFLFVRNVTDISVFKDVDLVLINSPFTDAEFTYKLLDTILKKGVHWCVLLKTDKYGQINAEKKPGMLPGLTRFLMENRQWSVIKHDKAGLGNTILSVKQEDKPKLPSKIQIAKNFAKALKEHVASGAEHVSPEELQKRLEICSICEHRLDNRCTICGCYITEGVGGIGKAMWKEQHCPLLLW